MSATNKANPAETLLKKIRKLDYNMSCPNCGTQAQVGVGFGNVCVKFKTFICDLCKFFDNLSGSFSWPFLHWRVLVSLSRHI
jgi:transposase-like protein